MVLSMPALASARPELSLRKALEKTSNQKHANVHASSQQNSCNHHDGTSDLQRTSAAIAVCDPALTDGAKSASREEDAIESCNQRTLDQQLAALNAVGIARVGTKRVNVVVLNESLKPNDRAACGKRIAKCQRAERGVADTKEFVESSHLALAWVLQVSSVGSYTERCSSA